VNASFEVGKDLLNRTCGIDQMKVVVTGHRVKLVYDPALVLAVALIVVTLVQKVHSGLPVVESPGVQDAWHKVVEVGTQVEDPVRHQSKAKHIVDPLAVNPAHKGTGPQGKDVAVGDPITNWYDSADQFDTYFTEATNKPAFGLFRNKPTVVFGGSNVMTTAANSAGLNGVTDCTLLLVLNYEGDAVTPSGLMIEYSSNYNTSNAFLVGNVSDPRAFGTSQHGPGYCTNAPASAYFDRTKPTVLGMVMNRNNPGDGFNKSTTIYINGRLVPEAEQVAPSGVDSLYGSFTSDQKFSIGAREGGIAPFTGRFGSIIIIKRQLTESEMSRISQAMLNRWAIGSTEVLV